MTSLSRRTTFPPGWAGEPLERRIALSRALPHAILRIPLANKRIDRAEALALLQSGDTPAIVARKLGFTRKTIERLRARSALDAADRAAAL